MKNIHVLPTLQSSRLVKQKYDTIDRLCLADIATKRAEYKRFNIYITNSEEIKEGDWLIAYIDRKYILRKCNKLNEDYVITSVFSQIHKDDCKKIILTTDQDLIKDGVQAIDDEFLEWFVKNPSCESIEVKEDECGWFVNGGKDIEYIKYNYIEIPKEEPKQDKIMERFIANAKQQETTSEGFYRIFKEIDYPEFDILSFKIGAEWQQENSYSEEEIIDLLLARDIELNSFEGIDKAKEWFEQFKKK